MRHTSEIVWHKFFKTIDGESSGPTTLTGDIGKKVGNETFYRKGVANYQKIRPKRPLPELSKAVLDKMSADQAYLYRIIRAIINGSKHFTIDKGLLTASPGKLHNARWLTLANRILRLYCTFEKPSKELTLLIRFVVDVYSPTWFDVVQNPSFLEGPRIFHGLVASLDAFPFSAKKQRKAMEDSINWNSYCAHPENVLLGMLTDEAKPELRKRAAKIINSLKAKEKPTGVRSFIKPKVDWKAESYEQLVKDLDPEDMDLEPPVTQGLTAEQVDAIADNPSLLGLAHLPCHTQAVERRIKDVTKVASAGYCIGVNPRTGNHFEQEMSNMLYSREIMPKFKSKQDYVSHRQLVFVCYDEPG